MLLSNVEVNIKISNNVLYSLSGLQLQIHDVMKPCEEGGLILERRDEFTCS